LSAWHNIDCVQYIIYLHFPAALFASNDLMLLAVFFLTTGACAGSPPPLMPLRQRDFLRIASHKRAILGFGLLRSLMGSQVLVEEEQRPLHDLYAPLGPMIRFMFMVMVRWTQHGLAAPPWGTSTSPSSGLVTPPPPTACFNNLSRALRSPLTFFTTVTCLPWN